MNQQKIGLIYVVRTFVGTLIRRIQTCQLQTIHSEPLFKLCNLGKELKLHWVGWKNVDIWWIPCKQRRADFDESFYSPFHLRR